MADGAIAHVHLDPLGGIAGDMFAAALLDARPELGPLVERALRAAGLPETVAVKVEAGRNGGLAGRRFVVEVENPNEPSGEFGRIRKQLLESDLPGPTRDRALAIYGALAEAEARVHGVPVDEVHFHELADWDSFADIVAAAALIEAVGAASWSASPLPLGGGTVRTHHGLLPVPAPATAILLEGLPVRDDGLPGERVTPTGAAILRTLRPAPRPPTTGLVLAATGHGLGTRELRGVPNVLRAVLFRTATVEAPAGEVDTVGVVRFEVDDQTGEDLAIGLDRLRALPGVLDVGWWAATGKRGRLVAAVQLLCTPAALEEAIAACFAETATIGLRWRLETRRVLPRAAVEVEVDGTALPVKRVRRPGGAVTAKVEARALEAEPLDYAGRARHRRCAETRAIEEDG